MAVFEEVGCVLAAREGFETAYAVSSSGGLVSGTSDEIGAFCGLRDAKQSDCWFEGWKCVRCD